MSPTKGRHRCLCRRVLLEKGDAPLREQCVGAIIVHRREGCCPALAARGTDSVGTLLVAVPAPV